MRPHFNIGRKVVAGLSLVLVVVVLSNHAILSLTFQEFVERWTDPRLQKSAQLLAEFRATPECGSVRWGNDLRGKPLSELPAGIPTEAGKLTLYADSDRAPVETPAKTARGAPVYLINRSGRDIEVPHQDGDIFMKLEMRQPDGTWVRCQTHKYSGCGNSYVPMPTLKDGHFCRIVGYWVSSGRPATLRYAIHRGSRGTVSNEFSGYYSNEFSGYYSSEVLEMARFDEMAFSKCDLRGIEDFLTCRSKPARLVLSFEDLREYAARQVISGRFPGEDAWSCIERVRAFDPAFTEFGSVTKENLVARHRNFAKR